MCAYIVSDRTHTGAGLMGSNEKITILRMLEEGRITAEEASRLIESAGKNHEPSQIRPASKASVAVVSEEVTKQFDQKVTAKNAELSITGINGAVLIKGYNGDKISAKVTYTPICADSSIPEFIVLGNKFVLSYNESDFSKVSVDAFVPEALFSSIKVTCTNGTVNISSIDTNVIEIENVNGLTELSNVVTEQLKCDTTNGNQRMANITAKSVISECFNASVLASNVDAGDLRIAVLNGGLDLDVARFARYEDYLWELECNNGKLNLLLPSQPDAAYHVSARAALAHVKIGLTGLNFTKNENDVAEAKSHNFDLVRKKVRLKLEASNAPITVN